jgi:hypothetical protein
MSPKSGKRLKARQEYVAKCLRMCALQVDPRLAQLKSVAEKIDCHPLTLSNWIAKGRVPRASAMLLEKHFKNLVDVEKLSQG